LCYNVSMLTNTIIILGFALLGFLIWWFTRRGADKDDSKSFLLIQNQLNELTRTMDNKIGQSTRAMQSQFSQSIKIIKDVTEGLTKLDETNKQVISFADQLQHMQDILQNPKQRGVLGEYYLETVLKNVLPPGRFQMQYKFADGETVDAAVFLEKDKILPVDSKFSLENYNRILEERNHEEKERLEKQFKHDLK